MSAYPGPSVHMHAWRDSMGEMDILDFKALTFTSVAIESKLRVYALFRNGGPNTLDI